MSDMCEICSVREGKRLSDYMINQRGMAMWVCKICEVDNKTRFDEKYKGHFTHRQFSDILFFFAGITTAGRLLGIMPSWGILVFLGGGVWFRKHTYKAVLIRLQMWARGD